MKTPFLFVRSELAIALLILFAFSFLVSAQNKVPDEFCISLQEKQLFDKVNTLLDEYDKKPVKLSSSLSYVAKLHVNDLQENRPDTSICNLSSWSDKGDWTACCYNSYVPDQECMWKKPKELTTYPYRGYELVVYFEDEYTIDSVINLWSESKQVLDMLLTRGNFKEKKWVCMGVGMNEHYVSIWFGQRADKLKAPDVCIEDLEANLAGVSTAAVAGKAGSGVVTYYLIFGSFSELKDAREAVKRYKKSGFENSGTLKSGEVFRVYLNKFTSLKEAMYAKQQLAYTYREAWVYKE